MMTVMARQTEMPAVHKIDVDMSSEHCVHREVELRRYHFSSQTAQSIPVWPSRQYVSVELPPRQESLTGHSKITSLLLLGRHAPGFRFTAASVDPSLSQLTSSGQAMHVPLPFMYEPFSHTHVVLPSPNVVIFVKHERQMVLFGSWLNLPCVQLVHCGYPLSLYFPGGHSPEHSRVIAPDVLLYVPPLHIWQSSRSVAPSLPLQRPAGQGRHPFGSPRPSCSGEREEMRTHASHE